MTGTRTLLLEIGVEELPPLSMRRLSEAFAAELISGFADRELQHGELKAFASPRRLALSIASVPAAVADREELQRGPPIKVAFDGDGQPTKATEAFAKRCGCDVGALETLKTDKGEWLSYTETRQGESLETVLTELLPVITKKFPIDRRMRWGAGSYEFVRPVHWFVALHGLDILDVSWFGLAADRLTCGHRFHAPQAIALDDADNYETTLGNNGYVIASLDKRIAAVNEELNRALASIDAETAEDPGLVEEVAAIVEWPKAVVGNFDPEFLKLPREVLISTLKKHQRYFPAENKQGALIPSFVTIANIDSLDPSQIASGNQKVITPRLADAVFFYQGDLKRPLSESCERLKSVVYEKSLGTLFQKTERVRKLSRHLAKTCNGDAASCDRIAELSRADLVSDMVGEFPDLQGVMGSYYAAAANEGDEVVSGLRDFYKPAFSKDRLPDSHNARLVGIAERLDTLAGVFAAGKKPKGNKDPFGLRRAALALARLILEGDIEVSLPELIQSALELQPIKGSSKLADEIVDFVIERLRAYYQTQQADLSKAVFDAVVEMRPASLLDFDARLKGVVAFSESSDAASLVAANKRIGNILSKTDAGNTSPDEAKLSDPAEQSLYRCAVDVRENIAPLLTERRYVETFSALLALKEPVDQFFDNVMVMDDDPAVREQRLALLKLVRSLFLNVADVSVMSR